VNHWTPADAAELDVLVHELTRCYARHRERCSACRGGCPELHAWAQHLAECERCQDEAPLTFGGPCSRRDEFLAHGDGCVRGCNPCAHVRTAIEAVVGWREARLLRSTASWLRVRELERERDLGRVHIRFDERGEVVEYEIAPLDGQEAA
jgi:hypothetical protein